MGLLVRPALVTRPAAGVTYATWNPSDKAADITLSNGNLTADHDGSASADLNCVRATIGKSSGKWYWEIVTSNFEGYIGVANASLGLTSWLGGDTNGWSYCGTEISGHVYGGRKAYSGNAFSYGANYGSSAVVISVALDMNAGKIWWAKDGVWQGSGDPANGTNQAFTGLSGTLFPCIQMNNNTNQATLNAGASAFSHSVPSGFNSGLYE